MAWECRHPNRGCRNREDARFDLVEDLMSVNVAKIFDASTRPTPASRRPRASMHAARNPGHAAHASLCSDGRVTVSWLPRRSELGCDHSPRVCTCRALGTKLCRRRMSRRPEPGLQSSPCTLQPLIPCQYSCSLVYAWPPGRCFVTHRGRDAQIDIAADRGDAGQSRGVRACF